MILKLKVSWSIKFIAHLSFSDHLLSGVCISFRLCMYVFLHFRLLNSEPLNDFQPNLVQSFIWLRSLLSSLIVQMVQRGDIKENKERIHNWWNVLKNILLKNQIHVVYNAQNCTQASWYMDDLSLLKAWPLPPRDQKGAKTEVQISS